MREHIHYALYSSVILAVMLIHGDDPISTTPSKLTIVLMSLLIFGEAAVRLVKAYREKKA